MSATRSLGSSVVSQLATQHSNNTRESRNKRVVCSSVCVYGNDRLGFNITNNALRIINIIVDFWRIFLDSSRKIGFQMPESGDVEVLNPNVSRGVGVLARRRVGLSLDFSDIASDNFVTKRCKIESMNIQINNGPYPMTGSPGGSPHRTIMPTDLACRLNKSKTILLIDCRPFFAYNANHIQGAVNINCSDRFNRRRLLQGKCSLVDLITSKEGKDLFKKRSSREIILYDDRTRDIKDVASDTSLYIVLSVLRREGKQAHILKGGLDDFQADYEELCKSSLKAHEHKPLYSPTTPIIEPAIETATASQILPFLYLGNERDAANLGRLQDLGITYVLNVTSHIPLHFETHGIKYKRILASDSGQQNLRQYFEEAGSFIDEARAAGARILVHCQAGVSRSATITVAFLLQHTRMSMTDAYRFVKSKRAIISPNFNFMGQLLEFEKALNQGQICRHLCPQIEEIETFI